MLFVDIFEFKDILDASFGSSPSAETVLVSVWARDIQRLYSPSVLQNSRIVSVEHRKSKRASEHEYILLTVMFYCDSPHIRYVRLDRRPSKRSDRRLFLPLGVGVAANDTISMSTTPFVEAQTYPLYSLSFDSSDSILPNMLDLITILTIVPSLAPRYHLYTSCCYWFSRMVFECLTHISRGRVLPMDKPQHRGKFAGCFVVVDDTGSFLLRKPRVVRQWEAAMDGYGRTKSKSRRTPPSSQLLKQHHQVLDHLFYLYDEMRLTVLESCVPTTMPFSD